jgi:hypothetical protein
MEAEADTAREEGRGLFGLSPKAILEGYLRGIVATLQVFRVNFFPRIL